MDNGTSVHGDTLSTNLYGYTPTSSTATIFIVLFGVCTIGHLGLVLRSKIWFLVILLLGGIGECIGWIGRLWASQNIYSLDAFLMQQISLILAPCFFSATVYALFAMLIHALGSQFTIFRPRDYIAIFTLCDIVSIAIQATGAGLTGHALAHNDATETGTHIMVAGIVFQIASMLVFMLLATKYYLLARKDPYHRTKSNVKYGKVHLLVFGMSVASLLILLRCIYRTVELAQGIHGFLATHLPYFLCFEAVPMVAVNYVFLFAHPMDCLPYWQDYWVPPTGEKTDDVFSESPHDTTTSSVPYRATSFSSYPSRSGSDVSRDGASPVSVSFSEGQTPHPPFHEISQLERSPTP